MRTLISTAMLAGVFGSLAFAAHAADLDYDAPPPPPAPYYEPHPVPPAFVPGPVPPVVYRAPVVYPRLVRAYPRPFYGPRPVVRVYDEPRPYAEGYGRPYPRAYGEPGFDRGQDRSYERDRVVVRRDREEFGRDGYRPGYEREHEVTRRERESDRYGHYLSRDELERRAERDRGGYGHDERFAGRERGFGRDDRFADRDFDR